MNEPLSNLVNRLAPEPLVPAQPLPGVMLYSGDCSVGRCPYVYEPRLCLIMQGRKRVHLGDSSHSYDPDHYLLNSVTMPVEFEVELLPGEARFCGITLELRDELLRPLISELGDQLRPAPPGTTLQAAPITPALADALHRLLRLAEDPQAAAVLAEGCWREIYFEVLRGPSGPLLANCVNNSAHANRMAAVIAYIDDNFDQKLDIDAIAARAHMSPSTLHEHFKQVTALSPMQYLKNLRLHRAHSMILAGEAVNQACFAVGYRSASQFSREFKRFFGVPPSEASPGTYTQGAMA